MIVEATQALDELSGWWVDRPGTEFPSKIRRIVGAIETHYKLTGPPGCSAEFLQQALYDAAQLLVRETEGGAYLNGACMWFRERGLGSQACENLFENPSPPKLTRQVNVGPVVNKSSPLDWQEKWQSVTPYCEASGE